MKFKAHPTILPVALLLLAVLACVSPTPANMPTPGSTEAPAGPADTIRTLQAGGLERTYIVHLPPGHDPNQPAPVVLVFHGRGGSAQGMDRITAFDAQADQSGFIAVYPNGTGPLETIGFTWNGGLCCGYAHDNNVDDVGFVRALLDDLATMVNVDARHVYATGLSNGAIMSYRLACELSDRIAAIGPVAATQNIAVCQPGRPVPVIHFHGTADSNAPYDGGLGSGVSGFSFAPVGDSIAFWVEQNGCPSQPQTGRFGSIVHDTYAPCDQGAAVELYTIQGGGHAWPGGQKYGPNAPESTSEISATELMWLFFEVHPLP